MMFYASEKNFENTLILSSSKLLGFFLSFLIPFFLSRWLTIEDYGTYKQLILVWMILMQVQNLGMDLGLFYFVKTEPRTAPIFSLNVIMVNFMTTTLSVVLLNYYAFDFANLLNNPKLGIYIPSFSLVLLFSIPSQHFEHYLVSIEKVKWAFVLEGIHEISKAVIIIVGFLVFNSLEAVLQMLAFLYLIKLGILVGFNLKSAVNQSLDTANWLKHLAKQISYGFPLGIARIISAIIYFDKLIISLMYSVTQFAVYSVGCFEIPFIHTVLNTIWELASLEMVEARNSLDHERLIFILRDTLRKIAILTIPIVFFGIIFGNEIIIFIFSPTYLVSVPYFRLFMLTFMANSFDCELVFRVFRENTRFLKVQIFNLGMTLSLMITLGILYGPFGALVGKVLASLAGMSIMFINVKQIIKVPFSEVIPWRNIIMISTVCLIFISIAYSVTYFASFSLPVKMLFSGLLYFPMVLVGFTVLGIITQMEKDYIKRKLIGLNTFAKSKVA